MDARSFAPALAVLLGVPFPRHMRAGEDDLDIVFDIADTRALPAAYVADRRAAVERFRAANRETLGRWLGPDEAPTWTHLYAREARAQHARFAAGAALFVLALGAAVRVRGLGARATAGLLAWAGLTIAATLAAYAALRHGLDFTSINAKAEFLRAGIGVSVGVGALSLVLHRRVFADASHAGERRLGDQLTLLGLLALAVALHPFVYGWPLGFQLPGAHALFFPFLAPVALVVHALVGGALCFLCFVRARRR